MRFLVLVMIGAVLYSGNIDKLNAHIIYNLGHILTHKKIVKVFVDKMCRVGFKDIISTIKMVKDCQDADIALTKNSMFLKKSCKDKLPYIISLAYDDYKRYKEFDAGVLFWQKGRPVIFLNPNKIKIVNLASIVP